MFCITCLSPWRTNKACRLYPFMQKLVTGAISWKSMCWAEPKLGRQIDALWVMLVDSLFKCFAWYSSYLNDEPLLSVPPPPFVLLSLLLWATQEIGLAMGPPCGMTDSVHRATTLKATCLLTIVYFTWKKKKKKKMLLPLMAVKLVKYNSYCASGFSIF